MQLNRDGGNLVERGPWKSKGEKVPLAFKLLGMVVPRNPAINRIYTKSITKVIMRFLMKEDDIYFVVPKDSVIQIDESLATKNAFLPSQIVHHYIDEARHQAIARYCLCRTKMGCRNHPREYGCLLLGEGVADGNNLLRHVTKDEAHQYVEKVRESGLVHTIGRTYADTLAFRFPKRVKDYHKKFMIVCNCCSCCCLARMYPYGAQSFRDMVLKMPGVEVAINDKCVGCGVCIESGVCMFGAIRLEGGRSRKKEDCVGCGRCAEVCPQHAIEITVDERTVVDSIDYLSDIVDVK